jgi:putative sterol carrier protein
MSAMAATIEKLLEALAARASERPLPPAFTGVVRVDAEDAGRTEQWYLALRQGAVTVARKGGEPDCVVRGDAATLAAVLDGRANMMAAVLRGALEVEGKAILMVVFQRLTPGETADADAPVAGYARRRS